MSQNSHDDGSVYTCDGLSMVLKDVDIRSKTRAERLGIRGKAIGLFLRMTHEEQVALLTSKGRLAGLTFREANTAAKADVDPLQFYAAKIGWQRWHGG